MNEGLPKRLEHVPIIEAIAEVRVAEGKPAAAELLVGALFQSFENRFSTPQRLPLADVPLPVRQSDISLRYAPTYRLLGNGEGLMIGDRSISVSVAPPYPGWNSFRETVRDVWSKAAKLSYIGRPERISVKYVNLLEYELGSDHVQHTKLVLKLGELVLTNQPTTFRTEVREGQIVEVIQVVTQATASRPGTVARHGLVVDIDVIWDGPIDTLDPSFSLDLLDQVHEREKRRFFSMLSSETLKSLGPEY